MDARRGGYRRRRGGRPAGTRGGLPLVVPRQAIAVAILAAVTRLASAEPSAAVEPQQGGAAERLRVLLVEEPPAAAPADPSALAAALRATERFEMRASAWGELSPATLAWAQAIVLGGEGPSAPPELAPLRERVRGGAGLVVAGAAAARWPGSRDYAALVGRQPRTDSDSAPEVCSAPVVVLDQGEPITQCVTHFMAAVPGATVMITEDARRLAEVACGGDAEAGGGDGAAARAPVLWVRREGFGAVVVLRLECGLGPSSGVVATLTARAVQHAGGLRADIPLSGDAAWYAATLAADPGRRRRPDPAGDGFYRGRQIAPVMSYQGAEWLVRPDRTETEEPERLLDRLEIATGSTVVDLGAGNGYFSLRLARRVGPEGRVLAVDIQPEMLTLLRERAAAAGIANVEPVLATERDPGLERESADLVLMVDVYHELSDPAEVMAKVREALRPKGRIALVEYRGEDPRVPIRPLHRMTEGQARAELEGLGFRWLETLEFLQHQHVLLFERAEAAADGDGAGATKEGAGTSR